MGNSAKAEVGMVTRVLALGDGESLGSVDADADADADAGADAVGGAEVAGAESTGPSGVLQAAVSAMAPSSASARRVRAVGGGVCRLMITFRRPTVQFSTLHRPKRPGSASDMDRTAVIDVLRLGRAAMLPGMTSVIAACTGPSCDVQVAAGRRRRSVARPR
ncbi:hypothetical protein [Micromonospora sp. NPDC005710]|uniref:hypothetical protein n=1 Tax=Micromonospora sp. NPDC005710 TaxID=3157051 RepID=UPI0033C11674